MADKEDRSFGDIERGPRPSPPSPADDVSDGRDSRCFSDAEDEPLRSPDDSNCSASASASARCCEINASPEPCSSSCASASGSDCSLEGDLESKRTSPEKVGRDCRICHLSLEKASPDSGAPIALGCSCKDDLAAAHRRCAETWFKIKGNKTCEICGSIAKNVAGSGEAEFVEEHRNEVTTAATSPDASPSETRSFWQGNRLVNFLLACVVFALVISWLFHFSVPG